MGAAMVTRNSIMISINLMRHQHTPSSPACTAEDLAPGSTHHLFFWASPAMYGSRYTAKRSLCQVGLAAATSSHDSLMWASDMTLQSGSCSSSFASLHSLVISWMIGCTHGGGELFAYAWIYFEWRSCRTINWMSWIGYLYAQFLP